MSKTTTKRKVTKKKAKKKVTKKTTTKKSSSFADELEAFGLSVMSEEDPVDAISSYKVKFRHQGLQKITGGAIGGKFLEISGDSQAGKSFLLYELMAQAIAEGGYALLFDGERALEEAYANLVGLNMRSGRFVLGETRTEAQRRLGARGEAITDMDVIFKLVLKFITSVRKKVRDKKVPIVVGVDSFPTMNCKIDIKNMEEGKDPRGYAAMQKNAKFSFWIEKLIPLFDKHAVTFVLLNQTRIDNSIMYGDKTVTLCENVIKFWATQRIRGKLKKKLSKKVRSLEVSSGKTVHTGMVTEWKTIKNRAVKPFQTVLTKIRYAKGIDPWNGMDELLVNENLIRPATTTSIEEAKEALSDSAFSKLETNKDGTKLKKKLEGFKLVKGEDKKFYASVKAICEVYPSFLEPVWTTVDSREEDEEVVEVVDVTPDLDFDMDEI